MDDVFNVEEPEAEVDVIVSGVRRSYPSPITAVDIKNIAKDAGIKKFTVVDEAATTLSAEDFPYSDAMDLTVKEYNEAK